MSNPILKSASATLLAIAALAAVQSAAAATATATLNVSATVSNNCQVSATPVSFGAYDPVVANAASALDAAGMVNVTCTNGAAAAITLSQGDNGSGSGASIVRRMADGSNFLNYALFQDAGRTTVWGNDTDSDVELTATGTLQQFSVYGRVAAGQNVPQGSYSDAVVVTVTF